VEGAAAGRPAAASVPTTFAWNRGRDHCEVQGEEVVCWSGEGRDALGSSCSLEAFLDGDPLWDTIASSFGADVLAEVKAAARHRLDRRPRRHR
jgi:hypothetical protein